MSLFVTRMRSDLFGFWSSRDIANDFRAAVKSELPTR